MWKSFKERVVYTVATTLLFVLGLGFRYLAHWSPNPSDPTAAGFSLLSGNEALKSTSPAIVERNDEGATWEVAYVTQRSFSESEGDYTGKENELHFGMTEVFLPRWRTRGSLSFPTDEDPDPVGKIIRSGDRGLHPDDFYEHILRRVEAAKEKDVLIFVHGYNVDFHEAICRIAQMAEDMPFEGVIVAFDWNSQANTLGYYQDKINTGRTHPAFAEVLAELRDRLPEDARLHVLAHSMGNRYTLNALELLAVYEPYIGLPPSRFKEDSFFKPQFAGWERWHPRGTQPKPLANVIFAAPDVHPETFQKSVGSVMQIADHITLYCNEADFALEISRFVNGQGKDGFRIGDSRSGINGGYAMDVVRLQSVSSSDPFGHSYYGSHPGLLTDLRLLIHAKAPIQVRPTVTAGNWPDQDKWYLR
ncbi:MAG: alpha/beta hydrolase [Planctomycetaceae bacterium]|nr:alpha/beta hydrolase [Planctomycetaceae bacterium]